MNSLPQYWNGPLQERLIRKTGAALCADNWFFFVDASSKWPSPTWLAQDRERLDKFRFRRVDPIRRTT